ncbi:SH3 domain-containing protein [Chloroflexota bacterium]
MVRKTLLGRMVVAVSMFLVVGLAIAFAVVFIPATVKYDVAFAAAGITCNGDDLVVDGGGSCALIVTDGWYEVSGITLTTALCDCAGAAGDSSGLCTIPGPGTWTIIQAYPPAGPSGTKTCDTSSSGGGGTTTVVNPDGTVTVVEEHEDFDPLDPDPNAVRAWGGYNTTFASNLIVYVTPYGYPYYHHTGQVIGVMDFNAVDIPEAICLIGSITGGNEVEIWRVDSYYMGGDQVQANLYENDVLTQEAWFDVPGLNERTKVPCQTAVPAPGDPGTGDGTGGGVAVVENPSPAGMVEVVCRQNLRQDSSTDTPVLAVMTPGTALSVWGRSNDNSWLEVTTPDGIQGWAFNGRCLNAGGAQIQQAPVQVVFESQPTIGGGDALTQAPAAPQAAAATSAGGPIVGITCRQNMRTGPGTNFAVDRVLTPGMTANVIGRSSDAAWLQLSDGSFGGWVYRGQCVMPQQGDVTAAPVTVAFGG